MSKKEEKEIVIDLSKKIRFTDTIYISIGSLLFSTLIALLQFIMALNMNNWVVSPSCWIVLLNYLYALRSGQSFGDKTSEKQASILAIQNTREKNKRLIEKLTEKIKRMSNDS